MARKGKNPDEMDTEKQAESKRRYRSPKKPPQAPRSSSGTHQGRGESADTIGREEMDQDFDTEDLGEGQPTGRGTSQEYGQGQRQGRGLSEEAEGATGRGRSERSWNELDDETDGLGSFAAHESDFDLQKASRDELNAIARELDIEDFETMNREELVMEIRERS